jgi:hypothetical protein
MRLNGILASLLVSFIGCDGQGTIGAPDGTQTGELLGKNAGLTVVSWGDPHEITGDGLQFENQNSGWFTALKSISAIKKDGSKGELMMVKRQNPCFDGSVMCNMAMGLYVAGSTVGIDTVKSYADNGAGAPVLISGAVVQLAQGGVAPLANNGRLTRLADWTDTSGDLVRSYQLVSPLGDVIQFDLVAGLYANITATASQLRSTDAVRGSLGALDADHDCSNDLATRFVTGTQYFPVTKNADGSCSADDATVGQFLSMWKTVAGDFAMAGCDPTAGTCY